MSSQFRYGTIARPVPRAPMAKARGPHERTGLPASGRIVRLSVGQAHGFIRLSNERDVFFHRADVGEGTAFNDLRVGDDVTCELCEDDISGARARSVQRNRRAQSR